MTGAAALALQGTPPTTPPPCGLAWRIVPSPNLDLRSGLSGVAAASANDVWAVGDYEDANTFWTLIQHWNGRSWSIVPNPSVDYTYLTAVAVGSATDVWAVGFYGIFGGTVTEHWDGSSWTIVPSPNLNGLGALNAVASLGPNDVWAVGFSGQESSAQTLIEHWDGSSWNIVPSPNPGSRQRVSIGVAAVAANDVWAVGFGDNGY